MVRGLHEIIGANEEVHAKAEVDSFQLASEIASRILDDHTYVEYDGREGLGGSYPDKVILSVDHLELSNAIQQILIGRI